MKFLITIILSFILLSGCAKFDPFAPVQLVKDENVQREARETRLIKNVEVLYELNSKLEQELITYHNNLLKLVAENKQIHADLERITLERDQLKKELEETKSFPVMIHPRAVKKLKMPRGTHICGFKDHND